MSESVRAGDPVPPKIYRAMKRDQADGLPVVGSTSSSELGARPGVDVSIDAAGNVVLDLTGMSVAPEWRMLDFPRIPKRLRSLVPGARGSNATACYAMGAGSFTRGWVASGLELIPDDGPSPVRHGVIAPLEAKAFAEYQQSLEATRSNWRIDET